MKLFDAEKAKPVMEKLCNLHYSNFGITRKVALFTKRINEEAEFCINEEFKIANKYVKRDENNTPIVQNGMIIFNNAEDGKKFEQEMSDLRNTEIEGLEKLTLNFYDIKDEDIDLTPNEIGILEAVIDWKED